MQTSAIITTENKVTEESQKNCDNSVEQKEENEQVQDLDRSYVYLKNQVIFNMILIVIISLIIKNNNNNYPNASPVYETVCVN